MIRLFNRTSVLRRSDLAQQALEPRLLADHVEVRLHLQADEGGAPVVSARLEQPERFICLANLRVTTGGWNERAALAERLSAFAQNGAEAAGFKRAADLLRAASRSRLHLTEIVKSPLGKSPLVRISLSVDHDVGRPALPPIS